MSAPELLLTSNIYDNRVFVNRFLNDMANINIYDCLFHLYHHQMLLILYGIRSIGKVFMICYLQSFADWLLLFELLLLLLLEVLFEDLLFASFFVELLEEFLLVVSLE